MDAAEVLGDFYVCSEEVAEEHLPGEDGAAQDLGSSKIASGL